MAHALLEKIKKNDIILASGSTINEFGIKRVHRCLCKVIEVGKYDIFVCGGGRKNKFLIDSLRNKINNKIFDIDDLNIDGDYIESQAFAFLAIRSYLGLPISFPSTTDCKQPTLGGIIVSKGPSLF